MRGEKIKEDDKKYIVNTYGRFDMVVDHASGATVYAADGKRYIDFTSGIGVNSLGYGDSGWLEAVTEQLEKFQHVSNLFYAKPGVDVARRLVERTGMSKVLFSNSGAEANEAAIKIARKYGNVISGRKRSNILTLEGSFHGRTLATIAATGQEKVRRGFDPVTPGFFYAKPDDIDDFKRMIMMHDPVAFMFEVVQGEGGVNALDKDFVKEAAEICKKRDVAVLIDEVQSGIGRTGTLFAYEQYGIEPDMVTFAKGIAGGLPMGGVICNEKFADVLKPGDHGCTFGMNPVCSAAASYVLHTVNGDFLNGVKSKSQYIREKLEMIPEVADTTGLGMMIGIVLKTMDASDAVTSLLENGVMALTAKDKIRLLPPLNISYDELDRGLSIIEKVLGV